MCSGFCKGITKCREFSPVGIRKLHIEKYLEHQERDMRSAKCQKTWVHVESSRARLRLPFKGGICVGPQRSQMGKKEAEKSWCGEGKDQRYKGENS